MSGDEAELHVRDAETRLGQWRGARAEVWDYTVSHSTFRLRLKRPDSDESVIVHARDCQRVEFDDCWSDAAISIEAYEGQDGRRYRVRDGNRLVVDCGVVFVSEIYARYDDIPKAAIETPGADMRLDEPDAEGQYTGIFAPHWEIPAFVVQRGRGILGLTTRIERWLPRFDEGVLDGLGLDLGDRKRPGRKYRMTVRGMLSEAGSYGHRGSCRRELTVQAVLSYEQVDDPGKLW